MSKGVIAAIIIAVLVVVGGGIAAAILLLGGDDDSGGDSSGALGAAEAFTNAIKDGDCDAAKDVSTEKLAGVLGNCEAIPTAQADEIGDPEITDESDTAATASVPVTAGGMDFPVNLGLVNQDGEWLVDTFDISGIDLPTASLPSASLPSIPSFSIPSLPSFSLPSIPSFSIPSFTIPTE